ncbi:LysE family translocator [Derxia lacustris]|uniref:LysE family translocator n=1 Tax=Derxia lacustris TaxID=764842 RepID=UPI000A174A87|nr:LysE family translocator [Derxia lacustris]
MVEPATLLMFVATSLLLVVTPGPTMLLALANGIAGGLRQAVWGMAGATFGSLLLIAAVAVGLGALLMASEALFELLRLLGVGYLVWLGIGLWRAKPVALAAQVAGADRAGGRPGAAAGWPAFRRSVTVQLSNPKALLFFSAFMPQFVDTARPVAAQYAELALVFTALDLCAMLAYASAGRQAVRLLSARGLRVINRGCAAFMFFLAAALALFRRGNV